MDSNFVLIWGTCIGISITNFNELNHAYKQPSIEIIEILIKKS